MTTNGKDQDTMEEINITRLDGEKEKIIQSDDNHFTFKMTPENINMNRESLADGLHKTCST